jgi:TRAP transporter TAXI family solute receptor
MQRKPLFGLLMCFTVVFGFCLQSLPSYSQEVKFFRIGTGSSSGTYFPIGTLIGSTITGPPGSRPCDDGGSCGVPGLIAAAQTTRGSVANIRGVLSGQLESALAQSDVIYAAYYGTGVFQKQAKRGKSLRVVANLYPEDVHLIVRKEANIKTVSDLKGKRISVDLPGSGTRINARNILRAYDITEQDYHAIDANSDKALNLLRENKLDAFFFIAGYPVNAVAELASAGVIELLPITGEKAAKVVNLYEFFSLSSIPEGTYDGISEVPTLAVSTQWVVSASMSEDLAYGITKALWHPRHRAVLDSGHAKGKLIQYENSRRGVGIPLHDGARKYYDERDEAQE